MARTSLANLLCWKHRVPPAKGSSPFAVFWVNIFSAELSHPLIAALGISVFIQTNKRPPDKHQWCPAGFLSPMGNFLSQSLVIVLCSCCSVEGASSCEPTVCTQLMTQKAEKVHITGVGRAFKDSILNLPSFLSTIWWRIHNERQLFKGYKYPIQSWNSARRVHNNLIFTKIRLLYIATVTYLAVYSLCCNNCIVTLWFHSVTPR